MESNGIDRGRSRMKSMEIKDHGKKRPIMVEKFQEVLMRIFGTSTNIT